LSIVLEELDIFVFDFTSIFFTFLSTAALSLIVDLFVLVLLIISFAINFRFELVLSPLLLIILLFEDTIFFFFSFFSIISFSISLSTSNIILGSIVIDGSFSPPDIDSSALLSVSIIPLTVKSLPFL
jgi:hypothetical protein